MKKMLSLTAAAAMLAFSAPAFACPTPTPVPQVAKIGYMATSSVGVEGAIGTMGKNINRVTANASHCVSGNTILTPTSFKVCTNTGGNAYVSNPLAAGASFGGGGLLVVMTPNLPGLLGAVADLGD